MADVVRRILEPAPMTRERTLGRMERLDAVTQIVSSAEHLARPQDRTHGGFNDWDVARRKLHSVAPRTAKVVDVVARPAVTKALHLARIGAGLALLAPTGRRTRTLADATIVATSGLLHPRAHYGTDGTDQVGFLVSSATALARGLHRRPALVDSVLWSVALQATLSYAASGWVKVASETWRSGRALPAVTRTRTYGDRDMHRLLTRFPRTSRVLATSVLGMECLFPSVFLWGGRVAPAWLHGTAAFHLVNARVMGLGRFVWAFGSMHPAVLYTTDRRNRGLRDDTLPKVTAALGAGALAAGFAAQAQRRKRVLRVAADEEVLTTRLGNELVLRRTGPADAQGPVVVLEHGLLSTPQLWRWTADALEGRHQVVTYARAGYGASRRHAPDPYDVQQSVDDLVDVCRHVGEGRGVVVAGHSLGGWIGMRAALRDPELVRGLALVDSSHPGELERSSRQAKGRRRVTDNLKMVAPSLSLGLGGLVEDPDYTLPEAVRGRFLDEYRDARMWAAGLREWTATEREFEAFDGHLPELDLPLLVLTAQHTATLDPVQLDLHRELAGLSGDCRHEQVAGVGHEGIVCDERAATEVAGHLADLVRRATTTDHDRTDREERIHVLAR
ncbi:alpha/beta fold hydrolase [Conexibacter sp. SYSU D00693]|uniref:alpha/beta fold hydrolase n=1 Tax=Conexibacter sp. SYSU D00693 TaxID=2812560 RepID=UPI00196B091B|nr:alpha/beta fold hydrolase [Conexibacter sp. SYSU D00693]